MKVILSSPMSGYTKPTFNVSYDEYVQNPQRYKSDWADYCPVDLNGAYVAADKTATDNLSKTQDNIQDRFNLETPDNNDDEDVFL